CAHGRVPFEGLHHLRGGKLLHEVGMRPKALHERLIERFGEEERPRLVDCGGGEAFETWFRRTRRRGPRAEELELAVGMMGRVGEDGEVALALTQRLANFDERPYAHRDELVFVALTGLDLRDVGHARDGTPRDRRRFHDIDLWGRGPRNDHAA